MNVNAMHHFRKSEILSILLNICFFQCQNIISIYNEIYCARQIPSISNLFPNTEELFKMIPNINEFVNRLLKKWTMLYTFQNNPRSRKKKKKKKNNKKTHTHTQKKKEKKKKKKKRKKKNAATCQIFPFNVVFGQKRIRVRKFKT